MEKKLYVGNLSYNTTEDELRDLFAQAGTVVSTAIIMDRMTGRSKGFGFVEMDSEAEAEKAVNDFNGYNMGNREIKVSIARPREDSGQGGGYGGGARRTGSGGGGYNRGGSGSRDRDGGSRRY